MSGRQHPGSQIEHGRLTWEYEIDLAHLSPYEQATEAAALESGFCGRTVVVRVGAHLPYDATVSPDVAWSLARARVGGVTIHLVGTPRAVRRWWTELQDLAQATPAATGPRLRAVQ